MQHIYVIEINTTKSLVKNRILLLHIRTGYVKLVFGWLLFILFINDFVKCFNFSKCLLFADDLKLYKSIKNKRDASDLQRNSDTLSSWCQRNRLYLNIEKCNSMSFYQRRSLVEFGYIIDSNPVKHFVPVIWFTCKNAHIFHIHITLQHTK